MRTKDLILDIPYKIGDSGEKVRLIQEWLCLNGLHVAIDGEYGPATAHAVKQFQMKSGQPVPTGIMDNNTFTALIYPLTRIITPIEVVRSVTTLGGLIAAYAMQHLAQHPREIGGQNRGPWVRFYMDGNEGPLSPWCAGFACTILRQACATLGIPLPIEPSFSCDELAIRAKKVGLFTAGDQAQGKITGGSFFLHRQSRTNWTHVGIVIQAQADSDVFSTIEGNTNDAGDREGYEVCERIRSYKDMDFIVWERR